MEPYTAWSELFLLLSLLDFVSRAHYVTPIFCAAVNVFLNISARVFHFTSSPSLILRNFLYSLFISCNYSPLKDLRRSILFVCNFLLWMWLVKLWRLSFLFLLISVLAVVYAWMRILRYVWVISIFAIQWISLAAAKEVQHFLNFLEKQQHVHPIKMQKNWKQ